MAEHYQTQLLGELSKVLVANTLHGVVAFSPDGPCLWANESAASIAGVSVEELLLHPLSDPFWGEGLAQDAKETLEASGPVHREVERGSNGSRQWIERVVVTVDLLGKPSPVVLFEDLSERKRAEESHRFAEFSIDKAMDLVYWLDPEARFVYVNEATCTRSGYSRDELLGMTLYDLDPWAPSPWKEHWEAFKGQGWTTSDARHRTKSGEIIDVQISAGHVEYEGKEFHCVFARDVTESKQMEEMARFTQASVDNAGEQIFWVTPEGKFVFVNEATCRQLGYGREELLAMNVKDIS